MKMIDKQYRCRDCAADMQPVKLLDATNVAYRRDEGAAHVELAYAALDANASFFTRQIPQLGNVRGFICPACGEIRLQGVPKEAAGE